MGFCRTGGVLLHPPILLVYTLPLSCGLGCNPPRQSTSCVVLVRGNTFTHKKFFSSNFQILLKSVKARAKGQPIIVVGTHAFEGRMSEGAPKIEQILRERLGNWVKIISGMEIVSCKTGQGIDALFKKVATIAGMQDHMGELIPSSYLHFEKSIFLENQKRRETRAAKPLEIGESELPTKEWKEMVMMWKELIGRDDEDELMRCCELLHDLGSLVYYSPRRHPRLNKLLDNMVISEPQWLTSAFATLLTQRHNLIEGGILQHGRHLKRIWAHFPAYLHSRLFALMERFELAYTLPLEGQPTTSLTLYHNNNPNNNTNNPILASTTNTVRRSREAVLRNRIEKEKRKQWKQQISVLPSLLPTEKPSFALLWLDKDPRKVQFNRHYQLSFIPTGLFGRLMIRKNTSHSFPLPPPPRSG